MPRKFQEQFSKPKTKPSFVIINVHHSITEDEVKQELLNDN